MRPRPGIRLGDATQRLNGLIMLGQNIRSSMGVDLGAGRNSFLEWVAQLERTFAELFEDATLDVLQTPRYWSIQSISSDTPRPYELMNAEIDVQVRRLERISKSLDALSVRLEHDGPVIAVPDTNVLLHYRMFDEVSWNEIVGQEPVLVAVPLRVVDELDNKKGSKAPLASRAGTVIGHLRRSVGVATGAPAVLRPGVTVQVIGMVAIDGAYESPANADDEILDTAESLAFTGKRVVVVTGDFGMQVRAGAREIETVVMPEDLRQPLSLSTST